ncbi:amidohydrolase [Burkholderia guangdongensis]|uniref:amidohydrolase n=1 Tax=Burkholderia guangdongensis TaxID=1792500 RepID=UPI0015CCC34F|nr:amidohydrolase [Burkholderia guangdongensis]
MQYADSVYLNGTLYTGDANRRFAQALAVRGGKIQAVGFEDEIRALAGPATRVVDLRGGMMLPGFIDGHVHPLEGHQILGDFDLSGINDQQKIVDRIRECAAATPNERWVYLGGANFGAFGAYPTRELLDTIVPDRPLLVVGFDVHSGCLNTKGLEALGIDENTPDISGGVYERDANRVPTGVVHEAAFYKICPLIPQLSPAGYPKSLAKAHKMAHAYGITGWFDARVEEAELKAYAAAQRDGTLKAYMSAGLYANPRRDPREQVERFVAWRNEYECDNLRLHTVKIFIDGVPESKTAALLEPYAGTDDCGLALWTQEALNEISLLADSAGFDLHFHTLADRAVRMGLDALEYVQQRNGKRDRRAQFAHLQIVDPADMGRFHQLGAIASMQALWTAAPPAQQQLYRDLLGAERTARNYPFRSLRNAGALLAGGSDWSVTTMDPLQIIQTGVTHVLVDAPGTEPWNPHERLDLMTMLEAHTVNAAYAIRFDDCTGSLEVGKDASFAILDRNPLLHPVEELTSARIVETCFRGEVVYAAPGWAD